MKTIEQLRAELTKAEDLAKAKENLNRIKAEIKQLEKDHE